MVVLVQASGTAPLPPPRAPPVAPAGAAAGQPAAIHTNTNAPFANEVEWNVAKPKLRLDLRDASPARAVMSDDLDHLRLLCTRVGMAMEDSSAIAILTGEASLPELRKVVVQLRATAAVCDSLLAEAEALL